jgi:hypothetical protein
MSAPDTNLEKQKSRHWPAIAGIVVALGLGVIIGLSFAGGTDVDDAPVTPAETSAVTPSQGHALAA